MVELDFDGRQRLAILRERGGSTRFREVGPVSGTDTGTGLTLTLDAARRVTEVRVPDAGPVRTPQQLRAAVRAAYQEADTARARASREDSREPAPAGDRVDVTPLLRPPPAPRRDIVRRTRAAVANGQHSGSRATLAGAGRSDNGHVAVTIGPTGVVEDVEADPAWLLGAREHYLESALAEAFRRSTEHTPTTNGVHR